MLENFNNFENLSSQTDTNAVTSEDEISRIYETAKEAIKAAKKAKKAAKKAQKAAKKAQKMAKKGNVDNCRNKEKNGNKSLFSKIKEAVVDAIPQIIVSTIRKAINAICELSTKKKRVEAS